MGYLIEDALGNFQSFASQLVTLFLVWRKRATAMKVGKSASQKMCGLKLRDDSLR